MKKAFLLGFVFCCLPLLADNPPAGTAPSDPPEKVRAFEIRDQLKAIAEGANTPAAWDAADAKIDGYQKEFGVSVQTSHNLGLLRQMELAVAKKVDPTRYQSLVKKLEADPIPDVAAMAKAMEAKDARMANLKTEPLALKFTAVDGTEIDLEKMRGKVVLIDFWATWCPPCRAEVPDVVAAYQKYHDQGFEVVGISLDQDKDALLAFTKQNGMVWPQYFDGKGWSNSVSSSFDIRSIPAMWLVGKDGRIATTDGRDDLAGQVEKLLKP